MSAVAKRTSLAMLSVFLSAPCLGQAGDYDRILIKAGGLMTPGLDIKINLHTGEVIRRSQERGGDAASQKWTETRRTLSPTKLTDLLNVIKANLTKTWESDECLQQDKLAQAARERGELPVPRMASMDGSSSLYMRFEGKSYYSPANGCETRAFDALSTAAAKASEPPATGAGANGS